MDLQTSGKNTRRNKKNTGLAKNNIDKQQFMTSDETEFYLDLIKIKIEICLLVKNYDLVLFKLI